MRVQRKIQLPFHKYTASLIFLFFMVIASEAQIGRRFSPEKLVMHDSITGIKLIFLTSTSAGDWKPRTTGPQWTADGQWLIFRSDRAPGETLAVNERTGDIVQVTDGSYMATLCLARKSLKLYYLRMTLRQPGQTTGGPVQIVEVDLEKLFEDSEKNQVGNENIYQRVRGTIPAAMDAGGELALDADEEWIYFKVGKDEAARYLPLNTGVDTAIFDVSGSDLVPSGICGLNIRTRELKFVVAMPFRISNLQTNPWMPGEIVFYREPDNKFCSSAWTVKSDGTSLEHLNMGFKECGRGVFISKDEIAFGIKNQTAASPGAGKDDNSGSNEGTAGIAILNMRTGDVTITGQASSGDRFCQVTGSPDGRWLAASDNRHDIYLVDRQTNETILLLRGHEKPSAILPDPVFSPDGIRIEIQTSMLSANKRTMNLCIIPVSPD